MQASSNIPPTSNMACCKFEPEVKAEESQNSTLSDGASSFEESLGPIINNIALPTVCVFGIVGNLLNLTILTRRKLQKSFRSLEQAANMCLIALAVSDLMFCLLAFLYAFLPSDGVYDGKGIRYFYRMYSTALINLFIMESTMLTVAMSLERYMAICFPLRQDLYLTTRRIKYIIVGSFLFSLAFNVPVLWRFEACQICNNGTTLVNQTLDYDNSSQTLASIHFQHLSNGDISSKTNSSSAMISVDTFSTLLSTLSPVTQAPSPSSSLSSSSLLSKSTPTGLRRISENSKGNSLPSSPSSPVFMTSSSASPTLSSFSNKYKIEQVPLCGSQAYELAYRICWALIGNFIPLILLFYFNVCLCRNIYLSYKLRRQFKRQCQAKSSSHILTVTLVVIVVMFFILVAPSEIVLLSGTSGSIEIIFNFLQSLNFSVNFILYCIISRHFRKTLKYLFLCGCYNIYQVSRDWKKEFETSLM